MLERPKIPIGHEYEAKSRVKVFFGGPRKGLASTKKLERGKALKEWDRSYNYKGMYWLRLPPKALSLSDNNGRAL